VRRRVFIDSSFVAALLDRRAGRHETARFAFDDLIREYERGATLLYTHGGVVAGLGERAGSVLRVCEVVRLRRWLIRAASQVERRHGELGRDRAATLVVMRRWRIAEIASFDPFFAEHGIRALPTPPDHAAVGDNNSSPRAKRSRNGAARSAPDAMLAP
jgi:predicted nucleic acid-binding protein